MMYKKRELLIIAIFIVITLFVFIFDDSKEETVIKTKNPIIVNVGGEVIRDTTLIYYNPTTYGVVINKIRNVKNEYSDFSKFDYSSVIDKSLDIIIPTVDINNNYSFNNGSKICINKATKEELITLYQIGEKRADKILLYIKEQKRITSWEILKEIISVSDESIKKIKEQAYL